MSKEEKRGVKNTNEPTLPVPAAESGSVPVVRLMLAAFLCGGLLIVLVVLKHVFKLF
ncbi:MAG TPA: hypothetical protein P5079_08050 [Elusimicrobiota bacterium]|nr:hypothetical protein [Elusimicrobiota bacterium]